ncbi:MAG: tRNA pseudouridine(55) synthase TruB [Ruminococcaceae bacterium]|nr:tRNA pseudouridine(55) synthase TruB [Oscillospiraceae bacterium]
MIESGIIVVNKAKDMTSHDCVNIIRRALKIKRVGHTGTLDPMATGILPVCIGKATKIADFISLGDKEYEAEFKLGLKTDTLDITGTVVKTSDVSPKKEEVIETINSFLGKIMQVPPMYSAKKIKGKKLYELARDGIEINRDPVEVEIKEIEILKIDLDENIISIRVLCSKGTYIRSLIDDIGEKLGTYATMTALNRTKSGMFTAEHPKVIDIMDIKKGNVNVIANLIGADKVFMEFPQIILSYNLEIRFKNGIFITLNDLGFKKEDVEEDSIYRVYSTAGEFMALGTMVLNNGNLVLKVLKSFY